MEKNRETTVISCLDTVLQEIRTTELTQQLKLSDGMPDIGRVLSAWGQVVLRGKEWRDGEVCVNGGIMVWVIYAPEDGSRECCIDSWIPFQMKWDLPEDIPEGTLRIRALTRFVDGRSTSPRKIMVRCGISVLAEASVGMKRELCQPDRDMEAVEVLENTYPLRLPVEAGEKVLLLDEELTFPDSAPQPDKLIYCRLEPRITDCRVLADKLAFRGTGNLHVLCRSEEGQLYSWDFPATFSQVAELDREYGADAQADILPAVTGMEADLDEEGHIRLKAGITAQYCITDRQTVTLVEDAYSPIRELILDRETLELPVNLEKRREELLAEQRISMEANIVVDTTFLPDFPRQKRDGQALELGYSGSFQVLCYGADGQLHSGNARWEASQRLNADEGSQLWAVPQTEDAQALTGTGQIQAKAELTVHITAAANQTFPMVCGIEPGQLLQKDPNRPALILRRAGTSRLWDIAKGSGCSMEEIRSANNLQGEPAPNQLLLIPVR